MRAYRRGTRRTVAAITGVAAVVAVMGGCSLFFKSPSVRIAGVRVTGIGFTGATAEIGLEVDNPNRYSLTSNGLEYHLAFEEREPVADREIQWRTIAEGESTDVVKVAGRDTGRVTVSVPFRYEDVGRAFQSFLQNRQLRYRLSGALRVDAPVGEVRVPFDETGDLLR